MNKLEERFQEVIGESDLHLPPWISENPSVDYPIEEAEVVSKCATITKEIAIGFVKWCDEQIIIHNVTGTFNPPAIEPTYEQLFEMYLETLDKG
jgi:hypothetical protein